MKTFDPEYSGLAMDMESHPKSVTYIIVISYDHMIRFVIKTRQQKDMSFDEIGLGMCSYYINFSRFIC